MSLFTQPKEIRVECEGKALVNIHDLKPFQGTLKILLDEDYEKLRKSIEELGFSDPFSIWKDTSGNLWVHDGHERVLTLKKMEQEGWKIPLLPASFIHAKDKTEAKKKLLANDSHYGKITEEGLTDFLNEEDSKFEIEDVSDFIELADIDIDTGETGEEPKNGTIKEPEEIECPECGAKFTK